jgi:hypothetical protein
VSPLSTGVPGIPGPLDMMFGLIARQRNEILAQPPPLAFVI